MNGLPYLGKKAGCIYNQLLSENVVLKVAGPFLKIGRTLTCEKCFNSAKLAKNYKAKNNIVGTVNRID